VVSLDSLVGSAATTVLFTLMMDACRADQTGTDYTIQASVVVLAVGGTSALSGVLCDALGYTGHFFAVAGLTALGVLAVAALLRQPTLAFPHSRTSEGL
jgi:predicted MFS family arabinose efflux permease